MKSIKAKIKRKPQEIGFLPMSETTAIPPHVREDCDDDALLTVEQIREKIIREIKRNAMTMLGTVISDAGPGRYLGMRFLFEMAGLHPQLPSSADDRAEESLTGILMRNLGLHQDIPTDLTPQNKSTDGQAVDVHAVK